MLNLSIPQALFVVFTILHFLASISTSFLDQGLRLGVVLEFLQKTFRISSRILRICSFLIDTFRWLQ